MASWEESTADKAEISDANKGVRHWAGSAPQAGRPGGFEGRAAWPDDVCDGPGSDYSDAESVDSFTWEPRGIGCDARESKGQERSILLSGGKGSGEHGIRADAIEEDDDWTEEATVLRPR